MCELYGFKSFKRGLPDFTITIINESGRLLDKRKDSRLPKDTVERFLVRDGQACGTQLYRIKTIRGRSYDDVRIVVYDRPLRHDHFDNYSD